MNFIDNKITNYISYILPKIALAKHLLLDENSMDDYNKCNDLMIKVKILYQKCFEEIINFIDNKNYNFSFIDNEAQEITNDLNKIKISDKELVKSITQNLQQFQKSINALTNRTFTQTQILNLKKQIVLFRYEILN